MNRSHWLLKLVAQTLTVALILLGMAPLHPAAAEDEFPQENGRSNG